MEYELGKTLFMEPKAAWGPIFDSVWFESDCACFAIKFFPFDVLVEFREWDADEKIEEPAELDFFPFREAGDSDVDVSASAAEIWVF